MTPNVEGATEAEAEVVTETTDKEKVHVVAEENVENGAVIEGEVEGEEVVGKDRSITIRTMAILHLAEESPLLLVCLLRQKLVAL